MTQATDARPAAGLLDKRFPALLLLLLAIALVSTIVAIGVGAVEISPAMVVAIIRDALSPGSVEPSWTSGQQSIVIDLRIPRAVLHAALRGSQTPEVPASFLQRAPDRLTVIADEPAAARLS